MTKHKSKIVFLMFMLSTLLISFILEEKIFPEAPLLYSKFILPGTFMHEGLHYFFALLTLSDPQNFNVIPEMYISEDGTFTGLMLGSVLYHPTWYNAAAIGLAPLFILPLTALFNYFASKTDDLIKKLFWIYLAVCGWASYMPSSVDFKNVANHPTSIVLACLIFSTFMILIVSVFKRFIFK